MSKNSKGLVPHHEDKEEDVANQEHLDWDFVLVAPPPKRSGKITCRLNYQGRSEPLAIDPVGTEDSAHD